MEPWKPSKMSSQVRNGPPACKGPESDVTAIFKSQTQASYNWKGGSVGGSVRELEPQSSSTYFFENCTKCVLDPTSSPIFCQCTPTGQSLWSMSFMNRFIIAVLLNCDEALEHLYKTNFTFLQAGCIAKVTKLLSISLIMLFSYSRWSAETQATKKAERNGSSLWRPWGLVDDSKSGMAKCLCTWFFATRKEKLVNRGTWYCISYLITAFWSKLKQPKCTFFTRQVP